MRIELSQVQGQSAPQGKPGSGSFTDTLREGDSIKAEVLSGSNYNVTLKTEGGRIFKARLESDVALLPGDKVILEVTGKEDGSLSLAVRVDDTAGSNKPEQTGSANKPNDPELEPYMKKLAELNMPVSTESAKMMRDLMAHNPRMTTEQAAFLVTNKLSGDAGLIKAALALLNNGEKSDTLLMRLMGLLDRTEAANPSAAVQLPLSSPPVSTQVIAGTLPAGLADGPQPGAPLSQESPLTDLLKLIGDSAEIVSQSASQGFGTGEVLTGATTNLIIPQSNSDLQSTIVEKIVEIFQNKTDSVEKTDGEPGNPSIAEKTAGVTRESADGTVAGRPGDAAAGASPTTNPAAGAQPAANAASAAAPSAQTQQAAAEVLQQGADASAGAAPQGTAQNSVAQNSAASQGAATTPPPQSTEIIPTTGRVLAEILSEIPQFRGTSTATLERFSNLLFRVAGDSAGIRKGETQKLETLLDKIFTRIGKDDVDAGERLRSAREELYARLTLVEEAISRAAPPAKAEMLEQTNKLMDHVRLLNNIDQFAYMQLPVMFGDEHKAAELYLFKKKGSKKPDPENINILLALELEHMGHWESLINFRKKDVSIQMDVQGEAEKQYFSDNTVKLHEMLAEAGFKLTNVGITNTGKETTPLTAMAALDRYTSGRAGAIDYFI